MNTINPHISQDVYNYIGKKLCNLYDSSQQSQGQTCDIVYTNEINGWKSISFNIPFIVDKKRNYRQNFIRNEYLLRMKKTTKLIGLSFILQRKLRTGRQSLTLLPAHIFLTF